MTVKKLDNGSYQARFQFDGKRYKKNFTTSREGRAWEADTLKQLAAGNSVVVQKDKRTLGELCERWYKLHGYSLKDGQGRLERLRHICKLLGDPPARSVNAKMYNEYRAKRINDGFTENNCNRELAYLRAVFNELIRQEDWHQENPLAKIRMIKFDEKEMRFLTEEEIKILINACEQSLSEYLVKVVKLCLRTGARWNEANCLNSKNVRIEGNRAWVIYEGTKSGKVRRVPITLEFAKELLEDSKPNQRLFKDCKSAFRRALDKTGIELPTGQSSHVLRHSFASHYMMKGGDILRLQKLLGHHSITVTMRYAHLAPDALDDVLQRQVI